MLNQAPFVLEGRRALLLAEGVLAGASGDELTAEAKLDEALKIFQRYRAVFEEAECLYQWGQVLIENGILKGFMSDKHYSEQLGLPSSGNGRRQSYRTKPVPRMTNTLIESGLTNPTEIIESVKNGLLVKRMGGGQVNITNGDFVFEVTGDVGAIVQVYWAMGVGGKHIQVGVPSVHETVSMQLTYTPGQHRDIIGCLFGDVHVRQDIPKFADMVMNGNYINLDKLITKKFKLEEINDVSDAMAKHQIIGRWVCEFD